jgi:hypothetical protein
VRAGDDEPIDEIDDYWNARYLSRGEGAWRVLGFNITKKHPGVSSLAVHLPRDNTHRQYHRKESTSSLSSLDHYFVRLGLYALTVVFEQSVYMRKATLLEFNGVNKIPQLARVWEHVFQHGFQKRNPASENANDCWNVSVVLSSSKFGADFGPICITRHSEEECGVSQRRRDG